MSKSTRKGLVWDDSGMSLEPRWEAEPTLESVKAVCQRTLQLAAPDDCAASFLAAGAFNRVYLVKDKQQKKFIMRVSLPVDPGNKTAGEVATLRWVRDHSDIPVPEVVAFDDSDSNEMGFEWILMQLMPGTSVFGQWRKLSMETKTALVKNIAEHYAHLFSTSAFRTIGTLKDDTLTTEPRRIVDQMFFSGRHFDYHVPRGPFRSSHDWLQAYISIIIQAQTEEMKEADDDEDREDAEYNLRVAQKLADLAPKMFPSIQNPPERTVVWHGDLSLSNIMVDDRGAMTAIIDWECVSAMPFWFATQMPEFLVGETREKEPRRDEYGDETAEDVARQQALELDDGLDNEGKNMLYWIHLMEYEQTQLRKVYSDHLSGLWNGWDEAVAEGALKVDFYGAVIRCADGFNLKRIEAWIDAVNAGQFPRLEETLRPKGA